MPEPTACLAPSESERRVAAARATLTAFRFAIEPVCLSRRVSSADLAALVSTALDLAALVEGWLPPVESGEGTAVGALGVEGGRRARPE